MKILLSFFLFTGMYCTAQVNSPGPVSAIKHISPEKDWLTFRKSQFSVAHPPEWTTDTSKKMGIDLFIFSPPDSTRDKFRENVNVVVFNMSGYNFTLDSFVKENIKQIEIMATDYKLIESKIIQKGSSAFHKLDFTARQGSFDLRFIQYYFLNANHASTITFTGEIENFNNYHPLAIKIMDSFVLEN